MSEALRQLGDEPRFNEITPDSIAPALKDAMAEAKQAIEQVKQQEVVTWDNTVEALTDITETVGRMWGVVAHLNSVVDTPELRAVYNELMPEVTVFFTEISQDIVLYERFKAIKNSNEFATLTSAQQQKLNHDLRDFVLSGAELPEKEQQEFAQLQTDSAQLAAEFSQNVLDSTDDFALYVEDEAKLAGLPDYALAMFKAAAEAESKAGYKIGLQMPHYLAVIQYADNRELREQIYQAYVSRASELNTGKWDNTNNINRRLQVAQQEAKLLGFNNFAELSLETKMADKPEQVLAFLRDLAASAKPFAEEDKAALLAFAQAELGLQDLEPWDLTYASEKLREAKYAFSEQEVKKYFPISKVLTGLFGLIHQLYGVSFQEKTVPTWHQDVRYFELVRDGQVFGGVYMDLYAREGKRSGAWMNDYRGRRLKNQQLQTPIAYLVCNFTPAGAGSEAYLTHDEIVTLFHETGHGLHHLLTEVDELGVSGINGVEWDAVELPSQFMENFAWELAVLQGMSAHETDGSQLPESLYQKMIAAKNFQKGLWFLRQMEFAIFDMSIYFAADRAEQWQEILNEVRHEVSVWTAKDYNRFAHSFGHIFAGGYAAGYYSYSWAEVLSADVYAAFEESNDMAAMGQKFCREVLAVGGSRSAMDSFKAFRGREPEIAALLRHNGLSPAA